ncbi:hypothetical protein D3C77_314360 [compost metagenome]
MSTDRVVHLEYALMAVIASAEQQGVDLELLRRYAINGLLISPWPWVAQEHASGAVGEIKAAVQLAQKEYKCTPGVAAASEERELPGTAPDWLQPARQLP